MDPGITSSLHWFPLKKLVTINIKSGWFISPNFDNRTIFERAINFVLYFLDKKGGFAPKKVGDQNGPKQKLSTKDSTRPYGSNEV